MMLKIANKEGVGFTEYPMYVTTEQGNIGMINEKCKTDDSVKCNSETPY